MAGRYFKRGRFTRKPPIAVNAPKPTPVKSPPPPAPEPEPEISEPPVMFVPEPEPEPAPEATPEPVVAVEEQEEDSVDYSADELADLSWDELRTYGQALGVKARSRSEMVDRILEVLNEQ